MKTTNANSLALAALLADARQGTFTGLIIRKKGETKGRGDAKLTYGDDLVHVVLYTGFKYDSLCQRSLTALSEIKDSDILAEIKEKGLVGYEGRGANQVEVAIDYTHLAQARQELVESLTKSMKGENESTNDHVFEPLVVNGETVRGSRVYVGAPNATAEEMAAPKGTIYLHGLKIGEKVIEAAVNGPVPESKSGPVVVAKNLLRKRLPVAKYVSYCLKPGEEFILAAGGTARLQAVQNGLSLTPEVEAALDRVMAG